MPQIKACCPGNDLPSSKALGHVKQVAKFEYLASRTSRCEYTTSLASRNLVHSLECLRVMPESNVTHRRGSQDVFQNDEYIGYPYWLTRNPATDGCMSKHCVVMSKSSTF